MRDDSPGGYGAAFADVYDEWYADVSDAESAVRSLLRMSERESSGASDRPAPHTAILELGVGTGRLALPLALAGPTVIGLDASPEMIAVLRDKPRSQVVRALVGDMTRIPLADGSVGLVFCAFNTFFNVPSESLQRRCLAEVRRILRPGGVLAIEAFVPMGGMPERGVAVKESTEDRVVVTTALHDPVSQTIRGRHLEVTPEDARTRPWTLRYATPDQLDEMARSVGLRPGRRMGAWDGADFTSDSESHVSVYHNPERR